jgi:hypothetical protein
MSRRDTHSRYNVITGEKMPDVTVRQTHGRIRDTAPNPYRPSSKVTGKVQHKSTDQKEWVEHLAVTVKKHGLKSPNRMPQGAGFAPVWPLGSDKPSEHGLTPDIPQRDGRTHHRPASTQLSPSAGSPATDTRVHHRPASAKIVRDPELHGYSQYGRAATHHHIHGGANPDSVGKYHGQAPSDITAAYRRGPTPATERPVRPDVARLCLMRQLLASLVLPPSHPRIRRGLLQLDLAFGQSPDHPLLIASKEGHAELVASRADGPGRRFGQGSNWSPSEGGAAAPPSAPATSAEQADPPPASAAPGPKPVPVPVPVPAPVPAPAPEQSANRRLDYDYADSVVTDATSVTTDTDACSGVVPSSIAAPSTGYNGADEQHMEALANAVRHANAPPAGRTADQIDAQPVVQRLRKSDMHTLVVHQSQVAISHGHDKHSKWATSTREAHGHHASSSRGTAPAAAVNPCAVPAGSPVTAKLVVPRRHIAPTDGGGAVISQDGQARSPWKEDSGLHARHRAMEVAAAAAAPPVRMDKNRKISENSHEHLHDLV